MEMTLTQLLSVANALNAPSYPSTSERFCIVVLDRGFVYVGHVAVSGDWAVIRDARNIRYWGTDETKPGLGWLAANGPTSKTKLDKVGIVRAPVRAVIHMIDAEVSKWNVS